MSSIFHFIYSFFANIVVKLVARSFNETGNHSLLFKAFASLDLIFNSPPLTAVPFLVN